MCYGGLPGSQLRVRDNLVVLRQWAGFRKAWAPRRESKHNWSAVERLIESARPYQQEYAATLKTLLEGWSKRFGMQDPLLNDLGAHRWINKETSYSDWLAWVLERLEPLAVFEILSVRPPFDPEGLGSFHVRRESQLDDRYIDLLICFDNRPNYAIAVEVKTYDEQYGKQKDYLKSLEARFSNPPCVLIAVSEDIDKDLGGFTLRPWRKVTFALREKIAEYAERNGGENRIVTAMMLGFVAAAEQNLLGFRPAAPRRVSRNEPSLISEELVAYLGGER